MNTPPSLHPPLATFTLFDMARVPAIRAARSNRVLAYYLSKEVKPRAKKTLSASTKPIVLPPHLVALPVEIRDKVIASLREKRLL